MAADRYSIRVLDDRQTLMFSYLNLKIQCSVCWQSACDGSSGSSFELTCSNHPSECTAPVCRAAIKGSVQEDFTHLVRVRKVRELVSVPAGTEMLIKLIKIPH